MWLHIGLKPEDQRRINQISLERDWSWISIDNPRLFGNHDVRLTGSGWNLTRWAIKNYLSLISTTFLWISLRVERLGIEEEIPRGVFENICSYL